MKWALNRTALPWFFPLPLHRLVILYQKTYISIKPRGQKGSLALEEEQIILFYYSLFYCFIQRPDFFFFLLSTWIFKITVLMLNTMGFSLPEVTYWRIQKAEVFCLIRQIYIFKLNLSGLGKVLSFWKPSNPTMLPGVAHPHMDTIELVLTGIQIWKFELKIILLGRNEPLHKSYTACFTLKLCLITSATETSQWNFIA